MKRRKQWLSVLLATAMAVSLTACGNSTAPLVDTAATDAGEEPAPAPEPAAEAVSAEEEGGSGEAAAPVELDTSERVDLVFYVMGDAPADEQLVEDSLNEILLEKLNATVDFQFSTWTDFTQKYNLELTSSNADLIYIANWLSYSTLASSGAFEELDDLLDTVAPVLRETVGETFLDGCRVNGKIYAVPSAWAEYVSAGLKYREDLREKYDLPVPDSIEDLEAYLLGIQENEPNQGLLTPTTEESQGLSVAFDAAWIFNIKYPWAGTHGGSYGLAFNNDTPSEVYDYWWSEDFEEDMRTMKRWADYGFWSKSALSDTNNSESYKSGLCVAEVQGQNPNKQIAAIQDFEKDHPDWKTEYIAYGEVTGVIYPADVTQNGTAIVRGCKNPERAMAVLELLMTDEEVNRLVQYGVEGVHYEIDGQGIYHNISDKFPYEGFNTWALRNGEYKVPQSTDIALNEMFDKYEKLSAQKKYPNRSVSTGFVEDYEAYSVERQAVSNVLRQYLAPLQAGLVDDVDAAIEEFRQKVTDAGVEVCREGYKEQWLAFCEEHGYE